MLITQSQLSMPTTCAGCGGPVACDDPYKVQSTSKNWWHTSCREHAQREARKFEDRLMLYNTNQRPLDPFNVFVWAVITPISVLGWLGCLAYLAWLFFFASWS